MEVGNVVAWGALAVSILALGITVGASLRTNAVSERAKTAMRLSRSAVKATEGLSAADLQSRLTTLEVRIQSLPDLWDEHEARIEEMKRHADRAYSRARAARSAAERARGEQGGADDEGYALRGDDAPGSPSQGVLALHDGVGVPADSGQQAPAVNPALDPYFLAGMKPFGA